jgi:hypothetical protein
MIANVFKLVILRVRWVSPSVLWTSKLLDCDMHSLAADKLYFAILEQMLCNCSKHPDEIAQGYTEHRPTGGGTTFRCTTLIKNRLFS